MIPKDFITTKHTDIPITALTTSRKITEIILHCSATAEGNNIKAATIKKWHLNNGWKDIGYHFVIDLDGTIEIGRGISKVGAHTTGHNTNSIGICYIGGCAKDGKTPKDTRTYEQKIALYKLVDDLLTLYPNAVVSGHYQWAAKACPSFKIETFNNEYKLWLEAQRITHKCNMK